MDTNALTGNAINRYQAIEKLLRKHYPEAKGGSLRAVNKSLADTLPAILFRTIEIVANVRNAAAHPDGSKRVQSPLDFDRLCDEIELLIPFIARRQHAKPAQPPNASKSRAPKPQSIAEIPKPQNKGVATNVPANRGKPWTDAEDKKLVKAFEARTAIPELAKAHQRGIGGIEKRLIKLGKLTTDQYRTDPPEPQ